MTVKFDGEDKSDNFKNEASTLLPTLNKVMVVPVTSPIKLLYVALGQKISQLVVAPAVNGSPVMVKVALVDRPDTFVLYN